MSNNSIFDGKLRMIDLLWILVPLFMFLFDKLTGQRFFGKMFENMTIIAFLVGGLIGVLILKRFGWL